MPSRHELNLRARALGFDPSQAGYANDSKLEQKVLWLEKNATTVTGAAGTQTLTSDATNVANNETVTIGSRTYTFKTALTPAAGEVLVGASAAASLQNLYDAINGSGTPGTQYAANTPVHETVTATGVTSTTVTVTGRDKAVNNADIATTETSAHLSFGAATLAGGLPGVVAITNAAVKDSSAGLSGDKNTSV